MYRQCELRRGTTGQVAWIPETFARVGNYLKITEDGMMEDGWRVTKVGMSRMTGDYLRDRERDHLYQRRMSDV